MNYVYVIQCNQYFKIGIASDIFARLKSLQTGNPYPLTVVLLYEADDAPTVEYNTHACFSHCRHRGEWFEFAKEQLKSLDEVITRAGGKRVEHRIMFDARPNEPTRRPSDRRVVEKDGKWYWIWKEQTPSGVRTQIEYGGDLPTIPAK